MKKNFTFLMMMGLLLTTSVSANDYFIIPNGNGDGSSWEKAMGITGFYAAIANKTDGDNFYFSGGTYVISTVAPVKAACNIIGGFASDLKGTEHSIPIYPATTPTVFQGPSSDNGGRLLAINTSTMDESKPVLIQGINFTGSTSKSGTETMGALFVDNSGSVTVKNCDFYNNSTTYNYGGQAFLSNRSTAYLTECSFYNNSGVKGGALRMRSSGDANAKIKGKTYLYRCSIHDNSVTEATGSAICVQHGVGLYIINSTIANNTSSNGGAVYVNGANSSFPDLSLYVINSTIAGNKGENQIQMSQGAKLHILNSIVVNNEDNGIISSSAVAITGSTEAPDYFNVTIDSKNFLGSFVNAVESPTVLPTGNGYSEMSKSNTYVTAFGNATLKDGYIVPTFRQGATQSELKTSINSLGIDLPKTLDLAIDQIGNERGDITALGAIAVKTSTGISEIINNQKCNDKVYNINGMRILNTSFKNSKGIYIINGKKVVVL